MSHAAFPALSVALLAACSDFRLAPPGQCASHAECDDGDDCTTDYCHIAAETCDVTPLDACGGETLLRDDFESAAGRLLDDRTLFGDLPDGGGWSASSAAGCQVGLDQAVDQRFDDLPAADFVSGVAGWSLTAIGDAAARLVPSPDGQAGDQSLELYATEAPGSLAEASRAISAQPSGWVSLRLRAPGVAKAKSIALDEGLGRRIVLTFDLDGQIKVSQAGAPVALAPYAANQWIAIKIEWDAASDRSTITIDGVARAGLPLHSPIAAHIDRLVLQTPTAAGVSFLVDDVLASGGEQVWTGAGASLRIGAPLVTCGEEVIAGRRFEPTAGGEIRFRLRATPGSTAHAIALGKDGRDHTELVFEPDGRLRWRARGQLGAVDGEPTWAADRWLPVTLRWQRDVDAVDLWVGDGAAPTGAALEPATPIGAGIDGVRVIGAPGGALWLDDLEVVSRP